MWYNRGMPEIIIPEPIKPSHIQDMIDRYAEKEWRLAFKKAHAEMTKAIDDGELDRVVAQMEKETPVGGLVAVFDANEFAWLEEQYGSEEILSTEFLKFYRKARNQTSLAAI